jgi:hypothetical protein
MCGGMRARSRASDRRGCVLTHWWRQRHALVAQLIGPPLPETSLHTWPLLPQAALHGVGVSDKGATAADFDAGTNPAASPDAWHGGGVGGPSAALAAALRAARDAAARAAAASSRGMAVPLRGLGAGLADALAGAWRVIEGLHGLGAPAATRAKATLAQVADSLPKLIAV